MADDDQIIQSIILQGIDQAVAQLQELGETAQSAFAQMGDAANGLSSSLAGVGDAADKAEGVGDKVGKAGEKSKEAGASFTELGERGTRAFEGLTQSSERFISSLSGLSVGGAIGAFEGLTSAVGSTTSAFGVFGRVVGVTVGAFGAAVAGTAALTYALKEFAGESASAIVGLDNLSKEAGTSFENVAGLKSAFADSGVSAEAFGSAMRIAAFRIQAEWPEIKRSVRDASDTIIGDMIKVREASTALAGAQDQVRSAYIAAREAAINAEGAENRSAEATIKTKQAALALADAQATSRNSHLALQSALLSVEHAEYNLTLAQGGSRDKEYEQYLKQKDAENALAEAKKRVSDVRRQNERDQLAEQSAALAYQSALRDQEKAGLDAEKSQIELRNAQRAASDADLKTQTLQIEKRAALAKLDDDRLKDINAIAATTERAGKGQSDAQKDVNLHLVETQDLFKSIILTASRQPGGATVQNTILAMADAFKAMGNSADTAATKLALVRQLGRGLGQEFVNALDVGGEQLKEDAGIRSSRADQGGQSKSLQDLAKQVDAARAFTIAQSQLDDELEKTKLLIGSTFFSGFTEGMRRVSESLGANRDKTVDWFKSLTALHDIIDDVFKVLAGDTDKLKSPWVQAMVSGFEAVKKTALEIADIIDRISKSALFNALFPAIQKQEAKPGVGPGLFSAVSGGAPIPQSSPESNVPGTARALGGGSSPIVPNISPFGLDLGVAPTIPEPGTPGGPLGYSSLGSLIGSIFNTRPRTPGVAEALPGLGAVDGAPGTFPPQRQQITPNFGETLASFQQRSGAQSPVPVTVVSGSGAPLPASIPTSQDTRSAREQGLAPQGTGLTPQQYFQTQLQSRPGYVAPSSSIVYAPQAPGEAPQAPLTSQAGQASSGSTQGISAIASAASEAAPKISSLGGAIDPVISALSSLTAALASAASTASQPAQGHASGGMIHGPGTSTSDSILARLSHGEFVMSAQAVQHYGASAMQSLNQMRLPNVSFAAGGLVDWVSRIKLPRFSAGGMVEMAAGGLIDALSRPMMASHAIPAFADGGAVSAPAGQSAKRFTLVLGDKSFDNLTGPDHVMTQLERHAVSRQLSSAGRKPSWNR
jgi:hypothetical protein